MSASGDRAETIVSLARNGPALSVGADLSVTVDETHLNIDTVGDRIRIQAHSLTAGFGLLRNFQGQLPAISQVLSEADLTADILVGDVPVAVLGAEAAPGILTNLVSKGGVELRFRALVPAILRAGLPNMS